MITSFIQARMASARFPGKVLAPLNGRPVVAHVLDRVSVVPGVDAVVVVTSTEPSDDPLAAYVRELGVPVFRGPLTDVFGRFRLCAAANPCEWILRVSADSPMIDPAVLSRVVEARTQGCDVVTTIHPRTFPKGQNAELIRTEALMAVDVADLTNDDREHVTPYFYRHAERFRIVNIVSGNPRLAALSLTVDTPDDLRRLERHAALGPPAAAAAAKF